MSKLKLTIVGSVLAVLTGCTGSTGHKSNEKYYLITTNTKISYWQAAAAGFYKEAKQLDVNGEMTGPEAYDVQAEKTAFDAAVAKNPAGILVSAADSTLLKPSIDAAIAKGVPVLTIDADSPDSKRPVFIGTNNLQAGVMGARRLIKELNGKGTVAVYTMPNQSNLGERMHGFKDTLAESPGIKISDTIDIKGDPRVAFDSTSDLMKGKTQPDAFVCLEAISCKEVADVLDRNKVTGKVIIAMDTDQGTLDWIKKGGIRATIAQKPYTMGYYGLEMLGDLFLHKPANLDHNFGQDTQSPLPVFVDTGATLIDKSNVDSFISARDSANSGGQ
jgi:ribose transport system substrate-binding protein